MSFMDNVDRLELSLHKVKEVSSKSASPSGPFTLSFSSPFSSIIREAEPGEREIFRYVGPKATPTQTHAPPSSSHQPLFELNPPKPATPLRQTTTSRGAVTDPDILLNAALKLVDGYRPMPRKRKLIVELFEKYEELKESIVTLEEQVETFDASASQPGSSSAAGGDDDGWGDNDPVPAPAGPSISEQTRKAEAEVKELERKVVAARKAKLAREKAKAEAEAAAAPPRQPTPPPPSPPRPVTPPAPINPLIQTPTITKFLNSSRARTPSRNYDEPQAYDDEVDEEKEVPEDADETIDGRQGKAGEEEEQTIVLAPPVVADVPPPTPAKESEPEPVVQVEEEKKGGVDGIEVTKEVEGILDTLWLHFPDILLQSPLSPSSPTPTPPAASTLSLLASLSSLPPPPPPSSSSLSLASTSTPLHPPTAQGVLLAHLFLLLLSAGPGAGYALTMGEVKRGVVDRVKGGAGGSGAGVGVDEGAVTKCVYWGVGKRGLVIKRGGGEARVGFA